MLRLQYVSPLCFKISLSTLICLLQIWNSIILLIDAIYTALWLPVVATFEYDHGPTDPAGALDLAVGVILVVDIVLRFHAPIRLSSGYTNLMLNDPRAIGAHPH